MEYLNKSTATEVLIGPFLDDGDGKTAETGLDVTSMECDLYKGITKSDLALTVADGDNDCAHVANGYYKLELTAGNTDTAGRMRITVNIAGALPVWHDYMVIASNVYTSLVNPDVYLKVDMRQINGDMTNGYNATLKLKGLDIRNDTGYPIYLEASDSNMDGVRIIGSGIGCGLHIFAGQEGHGIQVQGGTVEGAGEAVHLFSSYTDQPGLLIAGGATAKDIQIDEIDDIKTAVDAILLHTGTDGVTLADDAITSAKYDESTAFPIKSADADATQIARTGADSDTLETLSDEIAANASAIADGVTLEDGAITAAKIAADAITAAKIAAAAIDNATFAADVGTTAFASNPIAQAAYAGTEEYDGPTNTQMNARTLTAASYATKTNQETLLARIGDFAGTGLNTIKGFFQALFRSDAGVTGANKPSEINEAENGTAGDWDGTADSTEAISDKVTATGRRVYVKKTTVRGD